MKRYRDTEAKAFHPSAFFAVQFHDGSVIAAVDLRGIGGALVVSQSWDSKNKRYLPVRICDTREEAMAKMREVCAKRTFCRVLMRNWLKEEAA